MAAADTARLVASLTLDAKGFNQGVQNANRSLGKLEGTVGAIGSKASQGLKSFGRNVGLIGLGVAGGIAVAVKGGLQDLATLESAITSVDGAITQLNLNGQISGKEIAGWANDIERDIGAAFDDKEITAAAATLIRFGKVTPKNLKQALVVMTDLAAKTGDVDSASNLLAKALADPAKAVGKLAKAGVVLTKAQQDTIKEMVKQNDIAGAQQLILDELAKTTGGAAAASQGKYERSISLLNDVAEDARKALAEGFLPVIEKVADKLSKAVGDPKFIEGLRSFGTTLAGGLDKLISVAEKLPWATIGDSLKLAGAGAKAVLDAFTSLPPWVQTAVLTGWGLNKLTGGALTGIAGEVAKGLTKGLTGNLFEKGGSPANPLWVQTVGGGLGPGVVPAGTGKLATAANIVGKVFIVGMAAEVANILEPATTGAGIDLRKQLFPDLPTFGPEDIAWPFGTKNTPKILPGFLGSGDNGILGPNTGTEKNKGQFDPKATEKLGQVAANQNITNERLESIKGYTSTQSQSVSNLLRSSERNETALRDSAAKGQQAAFAIRDKVATGTNVVSGAVNAAKTVAQQTTTAARAAGQQTAAAIRDKDLSVDVRNTVNVSTSVSVKSAIGATQKVNKYTTIL